MSQGANVFSPEVDALSVLVPELDWTGCAVNWLHGDARGGQEGAAGLSSDSTPSKRLLELSQNFLTLAEANDDFLRNGAGDVARTLPDRSLKGVQQAAAQARLLLEELSTIPRQQHPKRMR